MQLFTITALVALAAVSSAQGLNNLPQCAQQCVGNGIGSTGCNIIDIACICKSTGWIDGLSCCVATKCSADDQGTTIKFANQICQVAGVTLPPQATCAGGASSTAVPTSTGAAAGTASAMASGSVLSSALGSLISSASGAVMSSASGSMGTTATPASGTASTTASTVAMSTGGAAHLIGQGMSAAGAAVAALVLL